MNNDPQYVNMCLPTFYLLSLTNTNQNLVSIFLDICIGLSRYSSKVILIMFHCRTCSDICNIHFRRQQRSSVFLWGNTGPTRTDSAPLQCEDRERSGQAWHVLPGITEKQQTQYFPHTFVFRSCQLLFNLIPSSLLSFIINRNTDQAAASHRKLRPSLVTFILREINLIYT